MNNGTVNKVLRFNDIPKGKHHIFCESFLVNYWVLEDSLWKPSSISYFVSDVNEETQHFILKRFNKDFRNIPVRIINLIYQ